MSPFERGLTARNPYLITDERNFAWASGYDKARREARPTPSTPENGEA